MGNQAFNDSNPYQYGVFVSEEKQGETPILRRPDSVNGLFKKNYIDRYTQLECVEYYKNLRPNSNFLGTREYFPKEKKYGEYKWKSWSQIYDLSTIFIYGITKLELCPEILINDELLGGEKKMRFMGIYSRNREELIISSFGCQMDSIILVTLYDTLGINSLEYILNQTELTIMIAETKNFKKILNMKKQNKLSKIKDIIYLNCNDEEDNLEEIKKELIKLNINLINYETVISTGKKCIEENDQKIINKKYKKVLPDDVFLICYTSGTMDDPKGSMITSKGLLLCTNSMYSMGYHLSGKDKFLSFLPFAHILEHILFAYSLVFGSQTGFYAGDPNKLLEDLQALKPTYFCAVPRVFEKIYGTIMNNINSKSPLIIKLFNMALNIKLNNYEKYGKLSHAFFDPIFFNKIKNMFGGELNLLLCGGAVLQKEIVQILKVMVGCPIILGYGQTENSGTVILSSMYDISSCSIGGIQNTSELKLIDSPEFNYFSNDVNPITGIKEPRGELCYRGYTLFKGYFKNSTETKKLFDEDGWLHSGDICTILTDKGNAIKIIDRAKNLFKLNQGEYIAPDRVQLILTKSKYINQIFVYGESQFSYLVALIYPELKECIKFLKVNKKWGDINYDEINIADLLGNKIMEEEIIKDCIIIGRKFDLKGFEIPKKIRFIVEPFTPENNLMTPTMKLKSRIIKMTYDNVIKSMYEE